MMMGVKNAGHPENTEMKAESEPLPEINARLPVQAQEVIGRRLKAAYEELVQEPVPDHLLALVQRLEQKEQGG